MRRWISYLAAASVFSLLMTADAMVPFNLPVSARSDSSTPVAGGWMSSGTMRVSFGLARRQLAVNISSAGWTHRHSIPMGRDRMVESWVRGGDELTLMTWRIAAGKTGYSYGITRHERQGERGSANKGRTSPNGR